MTCSLDCDPFACLNEFMKKIYIILLENTSVFR